MRKLRSKELMTELLISRYTLNRMVKQGLPYVSITPHTNKRIPVREAYEWMKELKAQNR